MVTHVYTELATRLSENHPHTLRELRLVFSRRLRLNESYYGLSGINLEFQANDSLVIHNLHVKAIYIRIFVPLG